MRIPTDQAFTFIAATGQLSGLLKLLGTDSNSVLDQPLCLRRYTVKSGDTCNSIAALQRVPTYQIICENDQINGECTNLSVGDEICLGRERRYCAEQTYVTRYPFTNAQSIANLFGIPLDTFEANNYCYSKDGSAMLCPGFNQETSVCVIPRPIGDLPKCEKIFI